MSDVADHLGVHPTTVARWERRDRSPSAGHVNGLADILGIDPGDLRSFFNGGQSRSKENTLRATGLRSVRSATRLSAVQLAHALNVPPWKIYNWESGRTRMPRDAVVVFASLIDVEVEVLTWWLAATHKQRAEVVPRLVMIRRRAGFSQAAAAARIGVSRSTLCKWERGEKPPLYALRALAHAYGQSVATIAKASAVAPPRMLDRRNWCEADFAELISTLREWAGMTQADLADRLKCSSDTVRSWERGRARPAEALRSALEGVFGLRPGELSLRPK